MPVKRKKKGQPPSARDLRIYEACVVDGRWHSDIATEYGISRPRVTQIVCEVNTALVPAHLDKINQMRVDHTAALSGLRSEAMKEWRNSQSGEDGPDPRFLEVARKCLADQRKIWGAEAETIHRAPVVDEEKPPPAIVMVMIESFEEFQEYERMLEFKDVKALLEDKRGEAANGKDRNGH